MSRLFVTKLNKMRVSQKHVVTAAHCTYHASKDNIKVAVGFTDLGVVDKARSFVLDVEKIINHPSYRDDSTVNDISILGITYNMYHGCIIF